MARAALSEPIRHGTRAGRVTDRPYQLPPLRIYAHGISARTFDNRRSPGSVRYITWSTPSSQAKNFTHRHKLPQSKPSAEAASLDPCLPVDAYLKPFGTPCGVHAPLCIFESATTAERRQSMRTNHPHSSRMPARPDETHAPCDERTLWMTATLGASTTTQMGGKQAKKRHRKKRGAVLRRFSS